MLWSRLLRFLFSDEAMADLKRAGASVRYLAASDKLRRAGRRLRLGEDLYEFVSLLRLGGAGKHYLPGGLNSL